MGNLELISTYYRYQQWANHRIFEAAERVPFDRLTTSILPGFDPVRSALIHTMWAQLLWLHRIQGLPPVPHFDPADFPDLDTIRRRWDEIDAATFAFIDTLTEERLAETGTVIGSEGQPLPYPLWQVMLHQANHQTYHRGEVAAVLTALGASPGEIDVNRMFDGRR
jgi:uncharacterized damage-inducible protein DinB